MKRFYKDVTVEQGAGGWQVMLDGRGIKTVQGKPQFLPTQALAEMLASEWSAQGDKIDPATFPLRDMADYAIDVVPTDPASVIAKLCEYGETDTLLYRADPDEPLYARQQEVWEPIVAGFEQREGVKFKRVSGIMHVDQDAAALDRLRARMEGFTPFTLAGLELMTSLAASLIIGLAATGEDADAGTLWDAASLEENWQADLWGRDEEAEERRAKRRDDFLRAHAFTFAATGATGG